MSKGVVVVAPPGAYVYAETGVLNIGVIRWRPKLPPVPAKAAHRRRYGRG